ncbi:MAG: hypothetical protein QM756_31625 [Polyangiaceae bacterium]
MSYRSVTGQAEASGISVEQIRRVVLERIGFSPHEGRALVFIVREADELTLQAANSLLKTLEEPPARTHFVLLTSRPESLARYDSVSRATVALQPAGRGGGRAHPGGARHEARARRVRSGQRRSRVRAR